MLDSGTLTPLLKRLEGAGLIHRWRSREDERQVLIHLTAAGDAMREKGRCVPEAIGRALGGTAEQGAQTLVALAAIRDALLAAAGQD